MTIMIEEIHAMLTEIVEKQRRDTQSEIDRLAKEKACKEESAANDKKWKEFVREEKILRDIEQNQLLNIRAAKEALKIQENIKSKKWWETLLEW